MTADSDGQTPKKMVGCFNITASLDHLDYDCVEVAGSVHVLGQCAKWLASFPGSPLGARGEPGNEATKWSFQHEIKAYFHFR